MTEKINVKIGAQSFANVDGVVILLGTDVAHKIKEEGLIDFFEKIGKDLDKQLVIDGFYEKKDDELEADDSKCRTMLSCVRYTGESECNYTGENCSDTKSRICKDYKSDEGLYMCPHCNRKGLKLFNYGDDKVWECLRCGAELWYCESVEEMLRTCREIQEG